jgi:phage-related holin
MTGETISSAKVFRSAIKTMIYVMFISAAHLMEMTTPILSFADELVLSFLAVTELISILENVGKMGFAVPKRFLNTLQ